MTGAVSRTRALGADRRWMFVVLGLGSIALAVTLHAALSGGATIAPGAGVVDRSKGPARPVVAATRTARGLHDDRQELPLRQVAALLGRAESAGAVESLNGRVLDPHGEPVEGARLSLHPWSAAAAVTPPSARSAATTSGADGQFTLPSSGAPDFCMVWAEHPEWASAFVGPIDVRAGRPVTLRLRQGQRVAGRILDPAGEPASTARVLALLEAPSPEGRSRTHLLRECRADEQGWFDAGVFEARRISLVAFHESGAVYMEGLLTEFGEVELHLGDGLRVTGRVLDASRGSPISASLRMCGGSVALGASAIDGSFELRLPAGHAWEVDVACDGYVKRSFLVHEPAFDLVWTLTDVIRIDGVAQLADGAPAKGASVVSSLADGTVLARVECDAGGGFELDAVATTEPSFLRFEHASGQCARVGPLDLSDAAGLRGLEITLGLEAGLHGRVVDASGAGLPGVEVESFAGFHSTTLLEGEVEPADTAFTDGSGSYQITLEGAGVQRVRFRKRGFRPHVLEFELDGEGGSRQQDVVLAPGGRLAGRLLSSLGTPLSGATVARSDHFEVESVTTGDDGSFDFLDVPLVSQVLLAEADHHAPGMLRDVLPDLEPVQFELVPAGTVFGFAHDVARNAPRTAFSVSHVRLDSDGDPLAELLGLVELPFRSEDGSFEVPGLPPGQYAFRISAPGFVPWESGEVVVAPAAPAGPLHALLERTSELAGRVRDPAGRPIDQAEVRAYAAPSNSSLFQQRRSTDRGLDLRLAGSTRTDDAGRWSLHGLPGGQLSLSVRKPGHAEAKLSIDRDPLQDQFEEIELIPATWQTGTAWFADGTPAADVTVFAQALSDDGQNLYTATQTSASGAFRLEGLIPGIEYQFTANKYVSADGSYRTGRRMHVVPPSGGDGLTIVIP